MIIRCSRLFTVSCHQCTLDRAANRMKIYWKASTLLMISRTCCLRRKIERDNASIVFFPGMLLQSSIAGLGHPFATMVAGQPSLITIPVYVMPILVFEEDM